MSKKKRLSHSKAFASFGEIAQGRLSTGEDFLVTLPVELWNTCELLCEPLESTGIPSSVITPYPKSQAVAEYLLEALSLESGFQFSLKFERDIPIGKGLSSSTADMLAVVRAFEAMFDYAFSETFISQLFNRIEPHEGLHYDMSVAYNHLQGRLLKKLHYIPDFMIVGVDAGGELSTVEYNRELSFTPSLLSEYDCLYHDLGLAFARQDDLIIAECAQRSTELHVKRTHNEFLQELLGKSVGMGGLGIVAAHSGTCGGILLSGDATAENLRCISAEVSQLGHVFFTRTLQLPMA